MINDKAQARNEIRAREELIITLAEELDPLDFFTAISLLSDDEDDIDDFYKSSTYRNLLQASQSNPDRAHEVIMRIREIDREIAEIDGRFIDED